MNNSNKQNIFHLLLFYVGFLLVGCNNNEFNNLNGSYLGQTPPGLKSELFAPGKFSSEQNEFNATFTSDGKEVYFTSTSNDDQNIMVIRYKNGKISEREIAPFSGPFRDVDPFITPNGKRLYFSSNRPINGDIAMEDCDFWYVEKMRFGGWGKAKHVLYPNTKEKHDFYYVSNLKNEIYYSIFNEDGTGDLYNYSVSTGWRGAVKLDYPLNTKYNDHDPFIAPDGSYLIFTSDRPGGYGSNDLYICFKNNEEGWSNPINMGIRINSKNYDYCPMLSPDGKYLFFSSSRSGNGDIYWIDAKVIEDFIPKDI
jgi:Tol biopolymer transport system component